MPAGTKADFKIYDQQYFGGQYEKLVQNLALFNGAAKGAFTLTTEVVKGDFERESFMKEIANLVARRDPLSLADVDDTGTSHGEAVGVKLNRRIGPVADTLDKWKKIAESPELFSFYIGRMVADQKLQEMVNTSVAAVEAALSGQAGLVHTSGATMDHATLVDGMAKMGDQAGNIAVWVMHSKPYFDLVKQSITDKVFGVANVAIYEGTAATLGKPTVVIDSPALVDAGAPATYNTLGLVAGAVQVKESEADKVVFQEVTGKENLLYRLQGEYAYNLRMKGFAYNTASGANPDAAAVATAANWLKVATQLKNLAGVRIVTN